MLTWCAVREMCIFGCMLVVLIPHAPTYPSAAPVQFTGTCSTSSSSASTARMYCSSQVEGLMSNRLELIAISYGGQKAAPILSPSTTRKRDRARLLFTRVVRQVGVDVRRNGAQSPREVEHFRRVLHPFLISLFPSRPWHRSGLVLAAQVEDDMMLTLNHVLLYLEECEFLQKRK